MCLAVPVRIEEMAGEDEAWVTLGDAKVLVNLCITPEAGVGDWVLVHAGFAIQLLDEESAKEVWSVLDELDLSMKEDPR